jgi:16S rRNA (adenine1518-N6/adenine1519-N6)-dimethyltransferase
MKTKKSLGQNFFINRNLCEQITNIILEQTPDLLVEIGPGTGSFTSFLKENFGGQMLLIEKDDTLATELKKLYTDIDIVNSDFLEYNLNELNEYKEKKILFWGSLPYNVSKPIIRKIISSPLFNSTCYFIIQKEVAEKYIAKEPNNNLLAVETTIYADVKKLFDISPDSFRPRPKVTSSFVSFTPKENIEDELKERSFVKFLQASFSQPRKTLKNNLRNFNIEYDSEIEELLSKRPQHLSLDEFTLLFKKVK